MASNPIGRDGRPVTLPGTFPPMPAVARILARHDRGKLAAFVTVAIDLLDVMDGDDDAEPATWTEAGNRNTHAHLPDDYEQSGDEADTSWTEWPTRGRHSGRGCGSRRKTCVCSWWKVSGSNYREAGSKSRHRRVNIFCADRERIARGRWQVRRSGRTEARTTRRSAGRWCVMPW